MINPIRSQIAQTLPGRVQQGPAIGGGGFNPYAAGAKSYGTGTPAPNYGPVDKTGYAMRDGRAAARRDALIRRAGAV